MIKNEKTNLGKWKKISILIFFGIIIIFAIIDSAKNGYQEKSKNNQPKTVINNELNNSESIPSEQELAIYKRHKDLLFSPDFDDSSSEKISSEEERVKLQVAQEFGITPEEVYNTYIKVAAYELTLKSKN